MISKKFDFCQTSAKCISTWLRQSRSWADVNYLVENWRRGKAEDSYAGASRDVDEAAAKVYFCFAMFFWWVLGGGAI